jgi:hypothetical protein
MPLKPMPPEAEAAAMDADTALGDALAIVASERPFSPKVVNPLVKVVTELAKLFGAELRIEPYTEPVEALEGEVARYLGMIEKAALDYGFALPIAIQDIRQDGDLTSLTAALMSLVKDPEFKRFLKEEQPEPEEVTEEVEVEEEIPGEGAMDADALFRSRMR